MLPRTNESLSSCSVVRVRVKVRVRARVRGRTRVRVRVRTKRHLQCCGITHSGTGKRRDTQDA
jgi:hypothetical protein